MRALQLAWARQQTQPSVLLEIEPRSSKPVSVFFRLHIFDFAPYSTKPLLKLISADFTYQDTFIANQLFVVTSHCDTYFCAVVMSLTRARNRLGADIFRALCSRAMTHLITMETPS
jgi:hypothetical protein